MSKQITYSDNDKLIVATLKENPDGLTLEQINEITGKEFKPGNMVATMKKNLIEIRGEVEVEKPGHRKVCGYKFVTDEVLAGEDGKAYNYTDGEKKVLAAAKAIEGVFVLSDLAKPLGLEKVGSGRINGLVKKGNIEKQDEPILVDCMTKATHKVYGFKADIPEA